MGVDRIAAGQVLRDLVDHELAVKEGGQRYAQYVLDPKVSGRSAEPDLFDDLRTLTETGAVVAVGATRSPKRRYQWVEPVSKQAR